MLRGLFIVLKYSFKRPTTIRYPEQRRKLPERSRGRHYLTKMGRWAGALRRLRTLRHRMPFPSDLCKAGTKRPGDTPFARRTLCLRLPDQYAPLHLLRLLRRGLSHRSNYFRQRIRIVGYTRENRSSITKEMLTEKKPGDSGRDPKREI